MYIALLVLLPLEYIWTRRIWRPCICVFRFLDDMQSIGKGLDNAKSAFESATKRLNSGRNNMVRVAEKIEELGAKVKPNDKSKVLLKKMAS